MVCLPVHSLVIVFFCSRYELVLKVSSKVKVGWGCELWSYGSDGEFFAPRAQQLLLVWVLRYSLGARWLAVRCLRSSHVVLTRLLLLATRRGQLREAEDLGDTVHLRPHVLTPQQNLFGEARNGLQRSLSSTLKTMYEVASCCFCSCCTSDQQIPKRRKNGP